MPDPITLDQALADACRFARVHGVERIEPTDFAIRYADSRPTEALYVDADVAVVVLLDRCGTPVIGFADLDWMHWPDVTSGTQPCEDVCLERRPVTTVQLPAEEVTVDE